MTTPIELEGPPKLFYLYGEKGLETCKKIYKKTIFTSVL